ncbi:uncharacterized protein PV09_06823 [Verruconis gallopava]|uniref:Uncharacterized protein n=1 Tax=Verruconis gallopava TaxID=253628 RepID=A0A0D1XHD6_9PEZI|nr:uncharacterized protein PV09_06823 [Verruconis gallopava]KIW01636.1 hypothetical protein PV09_06823 [Verruconis gallopava]
MSNEKWQCHLSISNLRLLLLFLDTLSPAQAHCQKMSGLDVPPNLYKDGCKNWLSKFHLQYRYHELTRLFNNVSNNAWRPIWDGLAPKDQQHLLLGTRHYRLLLQMPNNH